MGQQRGLREAGIADSAVLVEMMAEFYAEASYPLNRRRAQAAFAELLQNPAYGRVWILHESGRDVGYVVLTLAYSMEYGGLSAFIDDFYVRAAQRGRGLGREALAHVRRVAAEMGVRAIHLEVARENDAAQAVYRKTGFVGTDRQLLTLQLADPAHIE